MPTVTTRRRGGTAVAHDDELVDDLRDVSVDLDSVLARATPWLGKLALWMLLFAGAVYLGVGIVYVVLSCFFAIWRNLGSDKTTTNNTNQTQQQRQRPGRPLSAYSIFNPNQERIRGSIDPQQLQNQILRGGF